MKAFKLALLATAIGLSACGGDDGESGRDGLDGESGRDGLSGLVEQQALAAGDAHCPFGGVAISSGLDSDANGSLEAAEITRTEYLCQDGGFELQLLHFADVDGGRDILNNAVRFSAILDKFRSLHPNTVVLSSGDNWIPGPEYNVAGDAALAGVLGAQSNGRAHVAYLNALGVQASAFGNHEFDLGTGEVASLLAADGAWPGAQFPYLSGNLDFSADANLAALVGGDASAYTTRFNQIAASTIIPVGGELIGVVGATTPTLATISSPGDVGIAPADASDPNALAAAIQADIDVLLDAGIDKVILLAHMQQIGIERQLAPLLSGVDIIVAGGSNTILADGNDRLRAGDTAADVYPLQLTNADAEPVLIVNTDGDYTYLGRLVATFDDAGVLLPALLDPAVSGAYATDEQGLIENNLAVADGIDQVAEITTALSAALTARAGNVFGLSSTYLNGERGSVRSEETNLGNLTAVANLAEAQKTDPATTVSLKNGGGIRAPIGFCIIPPGATGADALVCNPPPGTPGISNPGEISQLDLEIALRFNNGLTLLDVTGAQLIALIEHGIASAGPGVTPGAFPQVAGIRFSWDPGATAGSRIQNLLVLDDNGANAGGNEIRLVDNGVPVAANSGQVFRIVTLGFLADGGDGYPFPSTNRVDLPQAIQTGNTTFADDGTEQDALAEYLFSNYPADSNAATPAFGAVAAEVDTPAPADTVIVNLSVVTPDPLAP